MPKEAPQIPERQCSPLAGLWHLFGWAAFFSAAVNLLMLTGPLFMLLVYDRVLPAKSVETLLSLLMLAAFFYALQAFLDVCRARVTSRYAAHLQNHLGGAFFSASLAPPGAENARRCLQELDAMQKALSAPVALAVFDLPWAPLFLTAVFLLHPALGSVAIGGAALLAAVTAVHHRFVRRSAHEASIRLTLSEQTAAQCWSATETVRGSGMAQNLLSIWLGHRQVGQRNAMRTADIGAIASACARDLRLFLQSCLLATGAWLCMSGMISSGAMVASSILVGRALAPVEGLIAGWAILRRGIAGYRYLRRQGQCAFAQPTRMTLPRPSGFYEIDRVTVHRPDEFGCIVDAVSFQLRPSQILGIVGPSGVGKSTVLRLAAGLLAPDLGSARLDGAHIAQYSDEVRTEAIGYLSQKIDMFRGSIAENIARMQLNPDSAAIVLAARRAGADQMIRSLPKGYDTLIEPAAPSLSGGQIHRIALARALFGSPPILCLDEPDAALDSHGVAALLGALQTHKSANGTTILVSHRPSVLAICDLLLSLDAGTVRAFGPRNSVMRDLRLAAPPQPVVARMGNA